KRLGQSPYRTVFLNSHKGKKFPKSKAHKGSLQSSAATAPGSARPVNRNCDINRAHSPLRSPKQKRQCPAFPKQALQKPCARFRSASCAESTAFGFHIPG